MSRVCVSRKRLILMCFLLTIVAIASFYTLHHLNLLTIPESTVKYHQISDFPIFPPENQTIEDVEEYANRIGAGYPPWSVVYALFE